MVTIEPDGASSAPAAGSIAAAPSAAAFSSNRGSTGTNRSFVLMLSRSAWALGVAELCEERLRAHISSVGVMNRCFALWRGCRRRGDARGESLKRAPAAEATQEGLLEVLLVVPVNDVLHVHGFVKVVPAQGTK